jgi:hypothetical protein
MTPTGKLDVHAHSLPQPYRQVLERAGHALPTRPFPPPERTSR